MDAIVQIQGLRKVYSRLRGDKIVALEGLDLDLGTPGTVHGFLGPNGSGKTTTIRCALGLIRPTAGGVRIFDEDPTTRFHRVASKVGAIVESPKMFPNFSGRKNLSLLATMAGIKRSEVDRVLDVVGLLDRAGDSFGSYSLGMRQRLAIAGALLKDPTLLILDEPANGLDPAGIAEMHRLIRQIAEDGRAVVVSSHQLAEMEQVCDFVTIVSRGRLIETGPLDHIRSFAGEDKVVATIDERDEAIDALRQAGIGAHPRPDEQELSVDIEADRSSEVTRVLATAGLYLSGLRSDHATLEHAFLNLTGDAPPPPLADSADPATVSPAPAGSGESTEPGDPGKPSELSEPTQGTEPSVEASR